MNGVWEWQLHLIRAFQEWRGPVTEALFRGLSLLGEESFFLIALPVLLWLAPRRQAVELGLLVLVSGAVNDVVKCAIGHPRPFELDAALRLGDADGFGLPSGHAQMAIVLWGGLAAWFGSGAAWAAASILALGIGLSRIFLGVHFPTDVLAGWALGSALLAGGLALREPARGRLGGLGLRYQLALALIAPLLVLGLHADRMSVAVLGALAGFGLGIGLVSLDAPLPERPAALALRLLIGLSVAMAIYVGLKALLPGEAHALYLPGRFLRYGLLALWISAGAPALFARLEGRAADQSFEAPPAPV